MTGSTTTTTPTKPDAQHGIRGLHITDEKAAAAATKAAETHVATPAPAGTTAASLIATEVAIQNKMWGDRTDASLYANHQLQLAATAQLIGLKEKQAGHADPFGEHSLALQHYYPTNWSGLRDYGSEIANMVVAAAFLQNEIDRLIKAGADVTRTARPVSEPYASASAPKMSEEVAAAALSAPQATTSAPAAKTA